MRWEINHDTRTAKEIAIDKQMLKFTNGDDSYARSALSTAYDDWNVGDKS